MRPRKLILSFRGKDWIPDGGAGKLPSERNGKRTEPGRKSPGTTNPATVAGHTRSGNMTIAADFDAIIEALVHAETIRDGLAFLKTYDFDQLVDLRDILAGPDADDFEGRNKTKLARCIIDLAVRADDAARAAENRAAADAARDAQEEGSDAPTDEDAPVIDDAPTPAEAARANLADSLAGLYESMTGRSCRATSSVYVSRRIEDALKKGGERGSPLFAAVIKKAQEAYAIAVGRETKSENLPYIAGRIDEAVKGRVPTGARIKKEQVPHRCYYVDLDLDLANSIDTAWAADGFESRAAFLRAAIRDALIAKNWDGLAARI